MRRIKTSLAKFFLFLIVLYIFYQLFAPSPTPKRSKNDDYEAELDRLYIDKNKNNHLPLRENNERIDNRINHVNEIKVNISKSLSFC
jgi:hypothetical protein